jgi:hypothetical protein
MPVSQADPYADFYLTLNDYMTGALGTGLSITMMVMGGAMAVAKNSPMPALTGIAGSAFLHYGPGIIMSLTGVPMPSHVDAQQTPVAYVASATVAASAPAAASGPVAASRVVANAASNTPPAATTASKLPAASAPVAAINTASAPVATKASTKQPDVATQIAAKPVPAAVLPHTVPVPTASVSHKLEMKAPSSHLTTWLGVGIALVIMSLLGLMGFASAKRKSAGNATFTSGASAAPSAASVFADPNGFTRQQKHLPSFKTGSNAS